MSDDALDVADIWLRSRYASIPAIPRPVHSDDEVRAHFRDVVIPQCETWIAEVEGDVTAVLALDGAWVEHLYVDPRHFGCGLGSQLLELAKLHRPSGLRLWTFQANDGARRFYERHGFVATDSTEGANEEGAPDVRYEWHPSDMTP